VVALVKDFLRALENDERAQAYLQELQNSASYRKRPNLTFLDLLGVKIAYWDQDVNRPLPPYLAEITFYDHKFRYYQFCLNQISGILIPHELIDFEVSRNPLAKDER